MSRRWGHRRGDRRSGRRERRCGSRRGATDRHRRRRIFWRVYGYGLLLLVVVVGSVAIASRLLLDGPGWGADERVARYVDAELGPLLERPAELQVKLASLHRIFGAEVAVYSASGTRLAAAGSRPPAPLDAVPTRPTVLRHRGGHAFATPVADGRAYVVGVVPYGETSGPWPLLLGVVLLVLAGVSAPLARGIVRPLERLASTARALGEGDLSARSGIDRRDEVGDLARAIDEMAARLERMVQSERELLANVSHELRTPLARIRVALELAEEARQDASRAEPEPSRHLEGIATDLAELEQLVEQVLLTSRLDLARGSDSALPLRRARFALSDLVEQVREGFAVRYPDRELVIAIDPDLELSADEPLLKRVLVNLSDNAAKYAEGPIRVTARREQDEIVIAVADRGPGVAPTDLGRLFDPFFRTDRSRERGTGGVGLGLALCRRIVEAHGGSIEARLPPEGGLEIRFSVPLAG